MRGMRRTWHAVPCANYMPCFTCASPLPIQAHMSPSDLALSPCDLRTAAVVDGVSYGDATREQQQFLTVVQHAIQHVHRTVAVALGTTAA